MCKKFQVGTLVFFFFLNSDAIKLKKNIRFLGMGCSRRAIQKNPDFWAYSGGAVQVDLYCTKNN